MRRSHSLFAVALITTLGFAGTVVHAQKHNTGVSPPTAPPQKPPTPQQPVVAVSSGTGALQITAVNFGVPAPQSLTRQLEADDERTRGAALAAIGAPGQYLNRGHIPYAHSIQLDFAALGTNDELDAILTAELDQHLVSAILVPDEGNWHRVASIVFPTPFYDPTTTPATFLRTARSFQQPSRYRAIYHSYVPGANGDYVENEAHVNVLNGKAVVTISFVSNSRTCEVAAKPSKSGCDLVQRWLQADPADPNHRFLLVSATGRLSDKDIADPLNKARTFQSAHLRNFACQPFYFSEAAQRYEPIAASAPCVVPQQAPK